jgi:hypothetical protein
METRKYNTIREVELKDGGTMTVGSNFTEYNGNGIKVTIEEPVGLMKITGVKRTVECNGLTSTNVTQDIVDMFKTLM